MKLCNEKFCIAASGNSMKSRDITPHTPSECLSVANSSDTNDEWTEFYMHAIIVGLFKAGQSPLKMHTLLKLLKVNECHVYAVKKFFKEVGDILNHPPAC